jgi:hypothetical protein
VEPNYRLKHRTAEIKKGLKKRPRHRVIWLIPGAGNPPDSGIKRRRRDYVWQREN